MKKLIYIEEDFISNDECLKFIDLSLSNQGNEMSYGSENRGGNTYLTIVDWKYSVVKRVNDLCKSFDTAAILEYVGVVRWPEGTFMKPHFDNKPDIFAAVLYLNNDFTGGHTCLPNCEVKPEPGKLIVFSNSHYLHHVSKVECGERFVLSFWYTPTIN